MGWAFEKSLSADSLSLSLTVLENAVIFAQEFMQPKKNQARRALPTGINPILH